MARCVRLEVTARFARKCGVVAKSVAATKEKAERKESE